MEAWLASSPEGSSSHDDSGGALLRSSTIKGGACTGGGRVAIAHSSSGLLLGLRGTLNLQALGLRGALCSSAFGGVGIGLAYGGGDGGRARELDDAGYGEQKVCRREEGCSQGGAHLGLRKVRRDGYLDS